MSLEALPEELDQLENPIYGPYAYTRSQLGPSSRLLDVGCGNAKVSAYLAESGATVDGIEPAATRAGVAATRVRHLSTVPAGHDDPDLLPAYDFVTFFDVIEHIAEPAPALTWALGKLAPGGRILASIPNSAHLSFRTKILRGDWSMDDWGLFDRTHLRFYDPTTMLALCPDGARLVEQRFYEPGVAGLRGRLLRRWPALFALHALMIWEPIAGPESSGW